MTQVRRREGGDSSGNRRAADLVDFIIARIRAEGMKLRTIAGEAGIRKSRLHTLLHGEREKRRPMRVDELSAVLSATGINQLEAALASELIENSQDTDIEAITSISSMLTELMRGLPEKVADMLAHIDGLEYGDVRKEHGRRIQAMVLTALMTEYSSVVERRVSRTGEEHASLPRTVRKIARSS